MSTNNNQMSTLRVEDSERNVNSVIQEKLNAKPDHRGKWSKEREFVLSCISMSVGLGNIWRFPYVAYENGGGAFLIPYLLILCVIGRPLYYMEMILGQFSGEGPIKVWKCVPAFKGVGFAQLISTSYLIIFYNYLIALTIYYFLESFQTPLPWTVCDSSWTVYCPYNSSYSVMQNVTESLPQQYYMRKVLNISSGLDDITSISWQLVLCLVLTVIVIYFTISRGVQSTGKVAYFTALFPYFVLITILIVSLLNDGAMDGIIYFFKPQWNKIFNPFVWYKAIEQAFFSLNVSFGSIIIYSSYNQFKNNAERNALIIAGMDTFTSVLAGAVIFAVLGSMAHKLNMKMEDVVNTAQGGGTGLAFIVYPEALNAFKFCPHVWSALFFFMLFVLGIGTIVGDYECILTSIKDEYTRLHKQKHYIALWTCLFFFLCGLPLTTNAGTYMLSVLDNYAVGSAVFFYAIVEVIGIMWIYGYNNFCADVEFMLKRPVSYFWRITWGFITPVLLIIIFIYGNYQRIVDENNSDFTPLGIWIIVCLSALGIGQIPFWALVTIFKGQGSLRKKIENAFSAKSDWGPKDPALFHEYKAWKKNRLENKISEETNCCDNHAFH